ncbi:MAG: carotenoid oxygenase family protein, partial [Minwuia sp.]|nr:carotenoid oxygenase family protein [Minwuia sp.]
IAVINPGDKGVWTEFVHLDLEQKTRTIWSDGKNTHLSEPVFVPANPSADEGDGWILGTAFRVEENRSDLLVFAATDLGAGPVATVELPHRVPHGFHGNWVQATT